MDDAMIARLLSTYDGAQPTVKNVNAARQFFATNPEIAEKRAMGLRGSGVDDNSDIFGAQLEKFMQSAEAEPPAGRVEVGPIEQVAAPTQQAVPRQAPAQMSNMPAQPGQSRQGGYAPPVTRESARPSGGFGLDDFLTALLGLSSTAGRKIMSGDRGPQNTAPRNQVPTPTTNENGQPFVDTPPRQVGADGRAPAPYAEDTPTQRRTPTSPQERSPAVPLQEPTGSSPEQKTKIQAEVDAENADAKRLEDQIMKRQRDQIETKKLSDAAKRAIGRR